MNSFKKLPNIGYALLIFLFLIPCLTKAEGMPSPSYQGYYTGAQLGWGKANYTASNQNLTYANTHRDGAAGRLFLGYQLSNHLGFETGYTKYSDVEFKDIFAVSKANLNLGQESVDATIKFSLPLLGPLDVWAKGGAAYMQTKAKTNTTAKSIAIQKSSFNFKETVPTYGFGVDLNLTHQLAANLGWNRIQGSDNGHVRTTDTLMVGVIFRMFI